MISTLLNYFLHDDVDSFKRVLADSGAARAVGQGSKPGGSSLSSSPNLASRSKKITGTSSGASFSNRSSHVRGGATPSITRAQINAKDQQGRTLLHLVASSQKPSAIEFARALLEIPFIDLYAQDYESGWTALHRALYAGNASIAQALMARDVRDVTDYSTPGHTSHPSGGLIKVKDREKNSPFDVYNATIANHNTRPAVSLDCAISDALDYDSDDAVDTGTLMNRDGQSNRAVLKPRVHLGADEVLTFGSNKNLSLGLGDEDDRQFPEAITVERPEHLLQHFYRERGTTDSSAIQDSSCLPTLIRHKPIVFMDVVMSKLHTAVLTTDPKANLYMCGFGPGGRLGTGDQTTRFGFVCIEKGGLADKRVVSVALGQDHSIAITEQGEVFTWGGNKYGQLGYSLPRGTNKRDDTPIQCTPRQIFNPFKREVILGAAASSIHSAVFSASGLYTFGKNEGQLGLVDSDARSLEVQVTPRRVGAALFSAPIQMVSAIDKATTVLLENHEVWVFTHYGYSKVVFPLDFSSSFIKESFLATRYDGAVNRIVKITSGRNTICALSSFGEVYTVQVNSRPDTNPTKSSTTNPAKIRNSLSPPERVWSVRKSHMAVRDVAVAQDGSIIICTTSGAAWRKEKRDKVKEAGSKDYKFVRVPGLSRVVAVRSNGFGAYAVAQQDCTVTKEKISVSPSTLWHDVSQLLPFRDLARSGEAQTSGSELDVAHRIKASILASSDIEAELQPILQAHELSRPGQRGRIWIRTTNSNVRIPVHEFILAGRSAAAERALVEFRQTGHSVLSDAVVIESDSDGQAQMVCKGADFMSILNVVYFLYIDDAVDVWRQNKDSQIMPRCRQIRSEVMRIATVLELRTLERAARIMVDPKRSLSGDLDMAVKNESFFDSGDVLIHLDGGTVRAHSPILCQRSPFFAGLFYGRSGGRWLDSRRGDDVINVDLKDIDRHVFDYVLRHVYGDVEEEMFDDVRCRSLDEFIDLILDVMSAANELMIDRLAQVCQKVLGKFVNARNVCHLLNAVSPCAVSEFKDAALEYICLNLEVMLENRLLDDLEEDMLPELDATCQAIQLSRYPVSRGRNTEEFLYEKYPELVSSIERDRQRRVDSMRLQSRLDQDELQERIREKKAKPVPQETKPTGESSSLRTKQSMNDLMFQMDEEHGASPTPTRKGKEAVGSVEVDDEPSAAAATPASSRFRTGQSPGSLDGSVGLGGMSTESPTARSVPITPQKQSTASLPGSSVKASPWGSPVVSGQKRDLKEIMAEASQSRVSSLTLGINNRTIGPKTPTPKLSQRERKRLQQQQAQEQQAAQQRAAESRKNPWQTVPKPGQAPTATSDPRAPRAPLTLRQTVAGGATKPAEPPKQARSVSTPIPTTTAAAARPGSTPTQPVIQSIRHTPLPERPAPGFSSSSSSGGQTSLAAILLQQQTEKDELREAVTAKHSLQDIQLEQEFQEWWDKESKRVMEAQAAAEAAQKAREAGNNNNATKNRRRGKGGRGRRPSQQQRSAESQSRSTHQGQGQTQDMGGGNRGRSEAAVSS